MLIGCGNYEVGEFEFLAPTTRRNALRVLRAMQLPKPGIFLQEHYFSFDSTSEFFFDISYLTF